MLFAAFLSMLVLDVFSEGYGFWETILALLIHLIPTGVILLLLAITWRWEWVGGFLFPVLGVLYLIEVWGQQHWLTYLVIPGPLILVGVLFLVSWSYREKIRERAPAVS